MATNPTAPCPVCTADVPLVDGQLITHRHRDQFGPCPAGQVEPAATGDKLAEGRCPNCERMTPLRDNGEIEYHTTQGSWQCAGTGQLPDTRTDLERAEWWEQALVEHGSGEQWKYLRLLKRERDRMRAELTKTVADCGICRLGSRTIHINDDCPRHGDTDGEA